MPESRPFQVDLNSVVDLLGRHIYSSPRVYLRELMQNGVDAISARREHAQASGLTSENTWGIRITPYDESTGEFSLVDDGIGLTEDEVADLLATVGRSSKRDIFDMRRTDYLGQFGIGLLSCFMVSDEIRILSRSAKGGDGVEWIGSGDGTFTVTPAEGLPIGTSVHLKPRFDTYELLSAPTVEELAKLYGEHLPLPISIQRPSGVTDVTSEPVFLSADQDRDALNDYAREIFGFTPMDCIPLRAPGTETLGVAFVLPFAPPPTVHPTARVYANRMLLSERVEEVLPEWAFFLRAVINSTGLTPTASRESLVEDHNLEYTRTQLGGSIRAWLMDMALHAPQKLGAFLHVHESAIKQLVLHDEEMAHIFVGWLSLETSNGTTRIERLVREFPKVRYARTIDEFRQIAPILPKDSPLVNGGYVYDSELCEMLPSIYPDVSVERADVLSELDRLDPPSLEDRSITVGLEDRASKALESRECRAVVRIIEADDIPSLYVADPEVFRHIDRGRASSAAGSGLWAEILAQTDAFALAHAGAEDEGFASRLCLNWGNDLIRSLAGVSDPLVFERCIHLLYVQSQLAGHRPLSSEDRTLMTTALSDLIALSTASE